MVHNYDVVNLLVQDTLEAGCGASDKVDEVLWEVAVLLL